jgi:hypothetical protein
LNKLSEEEDEIKKEKLVKYRDWRKEIQELLRKLQEKLKRLKTSEKKEDKDEKKECVDLAKVSLGGTSLRLTITIICDLFG